MSSWSPSLVVVDASALASLVRRDQRYAAVVQAVGSAEMVAPDLINAEVLSVLRRDLLRGDMTPGRAGEAVRDLADAPVARLPTDQLIYDAWALQDNLTTYDAMYVALALAAEAPLVTCDARLANAPVPDVPFIVAG